MAAAAAPAVATAVAVALRATRGDPVRRPPLPSPRAVVLPLGGGTTKARRGVAAAAIGGGRGAAATRHARPPESTLVRVRAVGLGRGEGGEGLDDAAVAVDGPRRPFGRRVPPSRRNRRPRALSRGIQGASATPTSGPWAADGLVGGGGCPLSLSWTLPTGAGATAATGACRAGGGLSESPPSPRVAANRAAAVAARPPLLKCARAPAAGVSGEGVPGGVPHGDGTGRGGTAPRGWRRGHRRWWRQCGGGRVRTA